MLHLIICGALGQMGRAIAQAVEADPECKVVAGVDVRSDASLPYPVYAGFDEVKESADAVVDFSRADNLPNVLDYARAHRLPVLICATAHTPQQRAEVAEAAKQIPVFFSYNNSLGIALMRALVAQAAQVLGAQYDIEIYEKHHRKKIDAPSGTAVMLFDALNQARGGELTPVYDRQSVLHARGDNEVGMMSFRGGTVVGEHSVFFAGPAEVIEVKHTAYSRDVFATGTLRAAHFLVGQAPGLYNMDDVLSL